MARLVRVDRKVTVPQVTTMYNCDDQKNTIQCTAHQTLRWAKLKLQWSQTWIHWPYWVVLQSRPVEVVKWCGECFLGTRCLVNTHLWLLECYSMFENVRCLPCVSCHGHSLPSSNGYFQQNNASSHKAKVISDWFYEDENELDVAVWWSESNRTPLGCAPETIEHLWDVPLKQ